MAPWDEKVPGAVQPGTTPQGNMLTQLLSTMFGRPNAAMGAPSAPAQQTPGIVGGAPPQLAGAPVGPSGAPAGANPGVPQSNAMPMTPTASRQPPSASQISQGPMEYSTKGGRDAAVVSSGIENLSEAIHGFKSKKDADELARAQNTMKIYQQASQIDPQTGQPVDPYTKHLYESDPKIVASWEKYLKMQFPREAADPSAPKDKKGKAPQGAPHIPQPQADPGELLKQLIQQKMLQGVRSGQTTPGQAMAEPGAADLSTSEWKKAMREKYGIEPKMKDPKEEAKLDSEIAKNQAEVAKFNQESEGLKAKLASQPLENEKLRAQTKAELALATERLAMAQKALKDAGRAKSLQSFTVGRTSMKDVVDATTKDLTKSRSVAEGERSKIGKILFDRTISPEETAKQDKLEAQARAFSSYNNMQDDVVEGKISAGDAQAKARRGAGLTSDYELWSGLPPEIEKAHPAKGVPDGTPLNDPNGVTQAVAMSGKWVAP